MRHVPLPLPVSPGCRRTGVQGWGEGGMVRVEGGEMRALVGWHGKETRPCVS